MCKHIIGISILLKTVGNLMPKNARDDVIGGPRGRGRPRKAVKRRSLNKGNSEVCKRQKLL